ncbi:formate dehydrogenase, nitrate-inducible, major subunit precursor [Tepidibacillus sp. HK-1]|nr:formate dehydrogenase, nitrate-inducible, major subunit precursor [Tepidibacillus sp. HK-1]
MASLAPSFGRGAMTNSFTDMKNAKVLLIGGNNTAENHPMAMRWVLKAQKNGAKIIVVDPRFNRTAKVADIYAQIRPGTDIAYLGAIVKYIIENKLYDEEYVKYYTTALYKVNPDFSFHEGLFSGFDEAKKTYNKDTWTYQLGSDGKPFVADSFDDPDTVLMKLKEHFKDYTFEKASQVTGIPAEKIKLIADTLVENRPGTILYALGMTQKTTGVQGIRMYAILQLLLGNMGMAGGGINANRGEPNVQGSTDIACLPHILPGYMPVPIDKHATLNDYAMAFGTTRTKQMIALLKAWYGDKATPENEFGYHYLPKRDSKEASQGHISIFENMNKGKFTLGLIFAQNPAVSTPNLELVWKGLSKLEMLVVSEVFETETASFWQHPGANPKEIKTEVILLPAAMSFEKAGTMTNSARWIQGKPAAVRPPGEAKPDADIISMILLKLKELYKNSTDEKDRSILDLTWDYHVEGKEEIDLEKVLKEINGYDLTTGKLLNSAAQIQKAEPGTVSSGLGGLYTGVITEEGNHSLRHDNSDPSGLGLYPNWTFAWPGNIRILYNRGSADINGKPRDKDRALVWWDGTKWIGPDILDVAAKDKEPNTPEGSQVFPIADTKGALFRTVYAKPQAEKVSVELKEGYDPNIFKVAPIFKEAGIADGPLPAHYEPKESPVENAFYPKQKNNPILRGFRVPEIQKLGEAKDYPYVLTTYMLTEQFLSGGVTRNTPQLNELMPSNFVEMSKNLAKKIGVQSGDKVTISTARGKVTIPAMVTDRIQTLTINGKQVEVVGVPWGWGFKGLVSGDSINLVTNSVTDPNTGTPEYKACLCNVTKGDK